MLSSKMYDLYISQSYYYYEKISNIMQPWKYTLFFIFNQFISACWKLFIFLNKLIRTYITLIQLLHQKCTHL